MKGYFVDPKDEQLRIDCYNAGMLDGQAAKKCFMSEAGYRSWRYRRNLETKNKKKWSKKLCILADTQGLSRKMQSVT